MRKRRIWVRSARSGDGLQFAQWSLANKHNEFDSKVPLYPSSLTRCAYNEHGPVAYLPIQQPIFLESLAASPDATKEDIALALKELVQATITLAHDRGAGEIYFLGTEDGTNSLAENQLFERLPWPVYRLRLSDLEKGKNE